MGTGSQQPHGGLTQKRKGWRRDRRENGGAAVDPRSRKRQKVDLQVDGAGFNRFQQAAKSGSASDVKGR
jgi:hypothetical protein